MVGAAVVTIVVLYDQYFASVGVDTQSRFRLHNWMKPRQDLRSCAQLTCLTALPLAWPAMTALSLQSYSRRRVPCECPGMHPAEANMSWTHAAPSCAFECMRQLPPHFVRLHSDDHDRLCGRLQPHHGILSAAVDGTMMKHFTLHACMAPAP